MSRRALLISLRDHGDPMVSHEHGCFAHRSGLAPSDLAVHFMQDGAPTRARLTGGHAIFFGGSGAYSVLDDQDWIRRSLDVLVETVDLQIPAWASCFGFHGLALALGGEVVNDEDRTELGSTLLGLTDAGRADPLLSALPQVFWAQEGHHDCVSRLPEGVELLATGEVCTAQAFRVRGAPFWASQFHPELTVRTTLDRFECYREQYLPAGDTAILEQLQAGEETPEIAELLPRLVQHRF